MISAELTLTQLTQQYPEAAAVLYQHQLDVRHDGHQTLAQIAENKAINLEEFLVSMEKSLTEKNDGGQWHSASDAEIIQYIQTRFHSGHRQLLPELIHMARRVESVHGDHKECPIGLSQHLNDFQAELEQHMQKEEQVLFPIVLSGHKQMAVQPVRVMQQDHTGHQHSVDKLCELTSFLSPPQDACNTWRNLYVALYKFLSEFKEHIHLEDNILFPRIEASVTEVSHG